MYWEWRTEDAVICSDAWTYMLKGKRNAYFDFQNVGFFIRTNFVLIPAIYTHWYRQLNSSTNFFHFLWSIPLAKTSLQRIGVFGGVIYVVTLFFGFFGGCRVFLSDLFLFLWLYVKGTRARKKSLSKKMDRWIIFRLNVVSLITNNDNSWSMFPVCNRFRRHE